MNVFWTLGAQQDRADIWDYIASDNPRAAAKMDTLFSDAVVLLSEPPKIGRDGKISGTRELIPHKNYRMVYQIEGDTVWILVLLHCARQWPDAAR